MRKTLTLAAAAALCCTAPAQAANLGFSATVTNLKDASGDLLSTPSKTVAVVDRDGDGLAAMLEGATGSGFLFDAEDWIITDSLNPSVPDGPWDEATGEGSAPNASTLVSRTYQFDDAAAGIGADRDVYLLWFPGLAPDASAPGAGQAFGALLLGSLPTQGTFTPIVTTANDLLASFVTGDGGLVGDLNGDGFVGAGDLDILLGVWNQNDTGAADLNGDGFIGAGDLDILLGNWNAGTPPTGSAGVVPEPASLALLALGAVACLGRRRA